MQQCEMNGTVFKIDEGKIYIDGKEVAEDKFTVGLDWNHIAICVLLGTVIGFIFGCIY